MGALLVAKHVPSPLALAMSSVPPVDYSLCVPFCLIPDSVMLMGFEDYSQNVVLVLLIATDEAWVS